MDTCQIANEIDAQKIICMHYRLFDKLLCPDGKLNEEAADDLYVLVTDSR
jgi:L-ascorbate metabolism protein UlaG (beta-lactamase superfamily)